MENSPLNGALITYDYGGQQQQQQVEGQVQQQESHSQDASVGTDIQGDIPAGEGGEKAKKKRRYKKKPPKPKRPKPGQVHIATALDGTILFCCPECHRAYPEKENLEQHLSVHKIERRWVNIIFENFWELVQGSLKLMLLYFCLTFFDHFKCKRKLKKDPKSPIIKCCEVPKAKIRIDMFQNCENC